MLYRTRWSSAASHAEAPADAVASCSSARLGREVRAECPAPTAWSVALPLWTSDSATNLPTVAPAPTACGYGPLGEQVPCQARCGVVGQRLRATPRLAPG